MSSIFGTYSRGVLTDQSSRSTFTYAPLDPSNPEIRLFRFVKPQHLSPLANSDLPRLELQHFSLGGTPVYQALSYVWGSSIKNWPILLNENAHFLTRSLGLALQLFELDDDLEWLWADALCINQDDPKEKSTQVAQMKQVFQNARTVLAWLGPPSEGSEALLRNVEREGKKLIRMGWSRLQEQATNGQEEPSPDSLLSSQCWRAFQSFSIMISEDRAVLARIAMDLLLRDSETGLFPHVPMLDFLGRPIWTRAWIVQEFAVARDLYLICEQVRLKYSHFIAVYFLYYRFYEDQRHDEPLGPHSQQFSKRVAAIFPIFWPTVVAMRHQSLGPLKDILTSVHSLGATDPRDRVYAVIGLANDAKLMGIRTDYAKSYTEMSIELAWRLFRLEGLWILTRARGLRATELVSSLPSWVPDWSLRTNATLPTLRFQEDGYFAASGVSVMCTQPSFDEIDFQSRSIHIMGTFVATVSDMGSLVDVNVPRVTAPNFQIARMLLVDLKRLSNQFRSFAASDLASALWQIPITHRKISAIRQEHRSSYQEKAKQFRQAHAILDGTIPAPPGLFSEDEDKWRLQESRFYLEHLCRKSDLKRPFACYGEREYLGMGPREMEPGDMLCIFLGVDVPYVVRKQDGQRYQLVGEAYIYNAMHGELMETNPVCAMIPLG